MKIQIFLYLHVFLGIYAKIIDGSQYATNCNKLYGQEGGNITGQVVNSSGGCSYMCFKDGRTINEFVKIDDSTSCDENMICYNGYCLYEGPVVACKKAFPQKDVQVVDMGCIVICNFDGRSKEIVKEERDYCKTDTIIGQCYGGMCKGNSYGQTIPADITEPPLTTPMPLTTPSILPPVNPTVNPSPWPDRNNNQVNIAKLCRNQFPYTANMIAYMGKYTEGCQYYCFQNRMQLHADRFTAADMTPCGGSSNKVCSAGFCRNTADVKSCQLHASYNRARGFIVETGSDPCSFVCRLFFHSEQIYRLSHKDGMYCGVNSQGQQLYCQGGYCRL